jgi:diguanylate cyclase (GGDEF)-like protein/PAS domain S-box-containing protein
MPGSTLARRAARSLAPVRSWPSAVPRVLPPLVVRAVAVLALVPLWAGALPAQASDGTKPPAAPAHGTPARRPPLLPIVWLGPAMGSGDTVRVAGRATVASGALHERGLDIAIDDGTGAIRVFSRKAAVEVREGDSLVATGVAQRYRGMAELLVSDVRVVPGPRRIVEPIVLARPRAGAELEGRLVRIRGVVREAGGSEGGRWYSLAPDDAGRRADAGTADSLAPQHAAGSGIGPHAGRVRASDELTLWIPAVHAHRESFDDHDVGDRLDVTGIVAAFQDNGNEPVVWQLIPRAAADVRTVGIPRRWYAAGARLALGVACSALLALAIARTLTRRSARALRETQARYAQLLALSPAPVLVHDGGVVLFANEAAARLFGARTARSLAGRAVAELSHADAPGALVVAGDGLPTLTPTDVRGAATLRARVTADGGRTVEVEVTKSACRYHDRPAAVVILRDIGDELHREAVLRAMAHVDELTGVANRRGFLAQAEVALERAGQGGRGATLVFADVDGLKRINDTYGHAAGDAAIRAVARALGRLARQGDVVARWSGDEFVALLADEVGPVYEEGEAADARRADALVERFRQALAAEPAAPPVGVVSASLGACRIPAHHPGSVRAALAAALERADAGLYQQKGARYEAIGTA